MTKPTQKKQVSKKEEVQKDEPKTEQQNPTIKVPPAVKEALDKMKQGDETHADVIQRLMIQKAAIDIPDDGKIPLQMTGKSYRTLIMALSPTPPLADLLIQARVS